MAVFSLTYGLAIAILIVGGNVWRGIDESQFNLALGLILIVAAYSAGCGAAIGAVTGLIFAAIPEAVRDTRMAALLGVGVLFAAAVILRTHFDLPVEPFWLGAGVVFVIMACAASSWLLSRLRIWRGS